LKEAKSQSENINKNRKASFEYAFLEKFDAGIQLTGPEIKSIRAKQTNISDAYCIFMNNEPWVKNLHISNYTEASYNNLDPKRDRKLLLKRKELKKLSEKLKDKGLAIVPTKLFISESGYAKLEIALAKGKKIYDKREDIKGRDAKRSMDRAMKNRR